MKYFLLFVILLILIGVGLLLVQFQRDTAETGLPGFIALTKADPLFYSSFFDSVAFSASVRSLAASEAHLKETAILNFIKNDAPYTDTFVSIFREHALFPTAFLDTLPAVITATDTFTQDPTDDNARHLLDTYRAANAAYSEAAASNVAVFEAIASYTRPDRPLVYFFVDSATAANLIKRDHELIVENAAALAAEIDRRTDCLNGTGSCQFDPRINRGSFFASLTAAPLEANAVSDLIWETLPRQDREHEVRGPYPLSSRCWEGDDPHWLFLIYADEENGHRSVMPKMIDQNYYRPVSASSTDPISKAVLAQGLDHYSQVETTTYECTDLTFYPRLLALDLIKRHLKDGQITLESVADSSEYIALAENQFGVIAPAYEILAMYTDLLEASQHTGSDFVLSPQFLYSTRSAYSLTFLPFARSIWRLDRAPKYMLTDEEESGLGMTGGYVTYTELKEKGYSDEVIKSFHINQSDLIHSLATP